MAETLRNMTEIEVKQALCQAECNTLQGQPSTAGAVASKVTGLLRGAVPASHSLACAQTMLSRKP